MYFSVLHQTQYSEKKDKSVLEKTLMVVVEEGLEATQAKMRKGKEREGEKDDDGENIM